MLINEVKMTPALYAEALAEYRAARARFEAYLEECKADRKAGHAPSRCPHGMNLWVEWDPICGTCEDRGQDWDAQQERAIALWNVRVSFASRMTRVEKATEAINVLHDLGIITYSEIAPILRRAASGELVS